MTSNSLEAQPIIVEPVGEPSWQQGDDLRDWRSAQAPLATRPAEPMLCLRAASFRIQRGQLQPILVAELTRMTRLGAEARGAAVDSQSLRRDHTQG